MYATLNVYICKFFLELWILVYWSDENSVSVHKEDEIKAVSTPDIGNECVVVFRGKRYTGRIAATG